MTGTDPAPRFSAVVGAELAGTFVVTSVVVGTSVIGATAIGPFGVAVAAGFAVLAVVVVFGRVSGAHVNPAVTIGLALAGRFPWRDVSTYVIAQCIGAVTGAALVLAILADGPAAALAEAQRTGFGAGGFGLGSSPGGYGLLAVALVEVVSTAVLVAVYCAASPRTRGPRAVAIAPSASAAIGATVVALTLLAVPVSNASFNPARSIAAALFAGPDRLGQVWAFVVFPLAGAVLAGFTARWGAQERERIAIDDDVD